MKAEVTTDGKSLCEIKLLPENKMEASLLVLISQKYSIGVEYVGEELSSAHIHITQKIIDSIISKRAVSAGIDKEFMKNSSQKG